MQFVLTKEFNKGEESFFYFSAARAEPGIGGGGKRTLSAQFGILRRALVSDWTNISVGGQRVYWEYPMPAWGVLSPSLVVH